MPEWEHTDKTDFCTCCKHTHRRILYFGTKTVASNGKQFVFPVKYYFCPRTDEYYEDETLFDWNYNSMKDAQNK